MIIELFDNAEIENDDNGNYMMMLGMQMIIMEI